MINVTIAGNVGKGGATVRQAGNDTVCGFSVACTRKDKDTKVTTWFDVSLWGKRGASLAQYINEGDKITVCGELSTEEYQGKTRLRVRAYDVALQGGGKAEPSRYGTSGAGANAKHTAPPDQDPTNAYGFDRDGGDGLPF